MDTGCEWVSRHVDTATYAICDSVNLEAALAKAFVDKSPDSLAAH